MAAVNDGVELEVGIVVGIDVAIRELLAGVSLRRTDVGGRSAMGR